MRGRVLLTGGTGLVGPDVVARLVARGYLVHCLSRRPPLVSGVTWIDADLAGPAASTLASIPPVDFVVHMAAARSGPPGDELAHLRRVNVEFSQALFDWAGSRRVGTVVYLSGFNILRRPLQAVITEKHPVDPVTPYAITKYEGELALAEHSRRLGFRAVTLRLSSPVPFAYDRLHDTVLKSWIDRAGNGQSLVVHGRGERTQDFVATEDIAAAVVGALESPAARGVYNVASGSALSMRELAELIAARWPVPVRLEGEDANGDERFNIAIDRARTDFKYEPQYTARAAIERLLKAVA